MTTDTKIPAPGSERDRAIAEVLGGEWYFGPHTQELHHYEGSTPICFGNPSTNPIDAFRLVLWAGEQGWSIYLYSESGFWTVYTIAPCNDSAPRPVKRGKATSANPAYAISAAILKAARAQG